MNVIEGKIIYTSIVKINPNLIALFDINSMTSAF